MLIGEERLAGPFTVGGGYVMPARVDYFYMLEALHKEYKGTVGIAMLNYCNVLLQCLKVEFCF
jgi:hypothetical protein